MMDLEDLRRFAGRDWALTRRLKDEYWVERKRRLGPAEGIRIAGDLRRFVADVRPGWPSAEERAEDLASHLRLSDLLKRADEARRL